MTTRTLFITEFGDKFWVTAEQAEALETLAVCRKGGLAKVMGYRPSTNVVEQPVYDLTLITRFSTEALYERKIDALNAITFADVAEAIEANPKLKALPLPQLRDIFNARKAKLIESMDKTLDGDRSDAHRQGHDRCYASVAEGVKVNFVTTKGADGLKYPELVDGFPVASTILLSGLEVSKTVRVAGSYKTVNSGPDVLMGNAIESVLNKRSVGLKTYSLNETSFERLTIDRRTLLAEETERFAGIARL